MKNKNIYPWLVVAMLWGVALLNYMDRQMLSTMKSAMQIDIVELESATNFGRLMAVFLWIYGLMSPISGIIADRMNRKWLIVGSLFVWSAVTSLMGGLYTGQAIGGFGATVAAAFTWNTTFHWFGIIGIVYALLLMFFLRDKKSSFAEHPKGSATVPKEKKSLFKGLGMLFSNLSFWIILLYFAAPSLPGWATKNWLPTLFADSLNIPMSQAGPIATITIALSSFIGVIAGGILSDKWVQKNIRGRVYTGAIGLGMTIPSLLLLGYGSGLISVVGAALCFGIGYGLFDANNMPILCQFVSSRNRATAYGVMNMVGVFAGAFITDLLGRWADGGNLGAGFAMLAGIVFVALAAQLFFLRPKTDNMLE